MSASAAMSLDIRTRKQPKPGDMQTIGQSTAGLDAADQTFELLRRYVFLGQQVHLIERYIKHALIPLLELHEGVCIALGEERGARYIDLADTPCSQDENLQWKQLVRTFRPTDGPHEIARHLQRLSDAANYHVAVHAFNLARPLSRVLDILREPRTIISLPSHLSDADDALFEMETDVIVEKYDELLEAFIEMQEVFVTLDQGLHPPNLDADRTHRQIQIGMDACGKEIATYNALTTNKEREDLVNGLIKAALHSEDPIQAMHEKHFEAAWSKAVLVPMNASMSCVQDSISQVQAIRKLTTALLELVVRPENDEDDEDDEDDGDDEEQGGPSMDVNASSAVDTSRDDDEEDEEEQGGSSMDVDGPPAVNTSHDNDDSMDVDADPARR